jgi:hypothetical protein
MSEIKEAIYSQNDNKSCGTDTLIAEIYKRSFPFISQIILELCNIIFESVEYPTSCGSEITLPIFKGGDINKANNNRGITLINIIAKIYSQVLLNRLTKRSTKYNKIIDNQY